MTGALVVIHFALMAPFPQAGATQQATELAANERARRATQQLFAENFRELQLLGIGLLKTHDEGSLLPQRLAKDARAIQRRARALRGLMVLGEPLARALQNDRQMRSPDEFDQAIRLLSQLVSDFAHNPIHRNSKVFNTNQAAQASADIVAIVDLAKVIERRARDYTKS